MLCLCFTSVQSKVLCLFTPFLSFFSLLLHSFFLSVQSLLFGCDLLLNSPFTSPTPSWLISILYPSLIRAGLESQVYPYAPTQGSAPPVGRTYTRPSTAASSQNPHSSDQTHKNKALSRTNFSLSSFLPPSKKKKTNHLLLLRATTGLSLSCFIPNVLHCFLALRSTSQPIPTHHETH